MEAVRRFEENRDRGTIVEQVQRLRGLELMRGFLQALYRAGMLEGFHPTAAGV